MPNKKINKICAERLAAPDFAEPKSGPLLSKTEWIVATVMLTVVLLGMAYMTLTSLPA